MDSEFWISELTDDDVPAVVALCRTALDLPEDAADAAEIVLRLRETTGTGGWSDAPRRLAGFIAVRSAGPGPTAAGAALSGEPVSVAGGRVIGWCWGRCRTGTPRSGTWTWSPSTRRTVAGASPGR